MLHTSKLFSLLSGDRSQVSQIAFVSNQHNDDVRVRMVPQLLQPSRNILVSLVFANIVDQKSTHGASIVGRCDCAISFLTCRVPDLCLNCLRIYLDAPGRKLNANSGLRIEIEFIARESTQEVGFTNSRVSDQDDCKT